MTQREFIAELAARTGLSQARVRAVVKEAVAVITEQIAAGEVVRLAGLGSFSRRWRASRQLRDITSSRKIYLDGRFVPQFRPTKALRVALEELTPQRWRDPGHQAARRTAQTLVGDLLLYHPQRPAPDSDDAVLRQRCAALFGESWTSLLETYTARVPAPVRETCDHLAAAIRARLAQEALQ